MEAGAVILAGGKSSRMGQNKALLPIEGVTTIERIKNCLKLSFADIVVVANDFAAYQFLQLPIVSDKVANKGPLAGIQAGLTVAEQDRNLFVACDMPFVSLPVAECLVSKALGYDAAVPVIDGRQHPLFAVYQKSILPIVNECLNNDKLRMRDLLSQLNVNYVTEVELGHWETDQLHERFFNMNDPTEYENAKNIAKK